MASNPYVNKVLLADGTTLIDLTGDTVTADKIRSGYTAHGADGAQVTGTMADIRIASGHMNVPDDPQSIMFYTVSNSAGYTNMINVSDTVNAYQFVYKVGSYWSTTDSTADPATELGFGTWQKVSPIQPTWERLKETNTWASIEIDNPTIYTWRRTA